MKMGNKAAQRFDPLRVIMHQKYATMTAEAKVSAMPPRSLRHGCKSVHLAVYFKMVLQIERLSVAMLIALILGFTEASLMHHHAYRVAPDIPLTLGADDATAPAKGRSATVGHFCALCFVGLQGFEPLSPTRTLPFAPTSSPLADPPAVKDLATSTHSNSKRGPPAA